MYSHLTIYLFIHSFLYTRLLSLCIYQSRSTQAHKHKWTHCLCVSCQSLEQQQTWFDSMPSIPTVKCSKNTGVGNKLRQAGDTAATCDRYPAKQWPPCPTITVSYNSCQVDIYEQVQNDFFMFSQDLSFPEVPLRRHWRQCLPEGRGDIFSSCL